MKDDEFIFIFGYGSCIIIIGFFFWFLYYFILINPEIESRL